MAKKKSPPPGPSPSSPPPAGEGPTEPTSPSPEREPTARSTPRPKAKRPAPARATKDSSQESREPMRVKAIELVTQASHADDLKKRTKLAQEAIKLDPDCAPAYTLLAEAARNRKTSCGLFEQAVAAAERTLGTEIFEDGVGHFWLISETRPYMHARAGLADACWATGRRDEAVEHLNDMLRLNPGDNQGLRYILAGWLLNLDRLDEIDALLGQYDEDSATWAFTRALAAFKRAGDTPAARKLLKVAQKANKHVIGYLTGQETLPSEPPPYYSPGDPSDAVLYVANHLTAWKSTPGSLTWIRSAGASKRKKKPAKAQPVASPEDLLALPVEEDTWQADFRQFTRRIEINGQRVRPWMVLVSSRTHETVLGHAMLEAEPTARSIWDILTAAMMAPAMGEPHRPTAIQVRPGAIWETLEAPLNSFGITRESADALDHIDFLFENLVQHLEGAGSAGPPGLLDMPGVTPERIERFYEVAADFYRRAPWRQLGYEAIIEIECDRYQSGPWYGVIMGQSGLTLGLALYEDLALLRRMYAGKLSDEEGARRTVALTVTFDDDASLGEADLAAIETNGWPIAAPEGYPSFFRKERGLSMRPPLVWEIDLMVACLAAVPDFIARRPLDDATRELVAVPDATGTRLELGLSWVPEQV